MGLMTANAGTDSPKWWPLMLRYALVLSAGLLAGWWATDSHYSKKIMRERISRHETYVAQLNKQTERTEHYKSISEKYYADYQDAINSEPVTVVERVYVRASCPVPTTTNSSGSVGNGAQYVSAELHAETVARITAVTQRAERDVKKCRAQLHSLQDKITTHNKAQ